MPPMEPKLFDGYTGDDIEYMGGESIINETVGLGGFAQAAAFPLQEYQGGSAERMVETNLEMYEITAGEHPEFNIPFRASGECRPASMSIGWSTPASRRPWTSASRAAAAGNRRRCPPCAASVLRGSCNRAQAEVSVMPVENLEYVERALSLVEQARERGLELRILGSLAYRLHCPANIELFEQMQRDLTDVDLAARSDQRRDVRAWLESLGFVVDQDLLVATEGKRYCFGDPQSSLFVDIFFDELYFCHPIPLRDRLKLDYPTITPTDLLLEKTQIVEINPKDIKDSLVLLLEHPLDASGKDAIDHTYVAKLLGADWGFYYTVTTNLARLRRHLGDGELSAEQVRIVEERIGGLERAIEEEPKTSKWKLRARIGTRKRWYQEVAEKSQTF